MISGIDIFPCSWYFESFVLIFSFQNKALLKFKTNFGGISDRFG